MHLSDVTITQDWALPRASTPSQRAAKPLGIASDTRLADASPRCRYVATVSGYIDPMLAIRVQVSVPSLTGQSLRSSSRSRAGRSPVSHQCSSTWPSPSWCESGSSPQLFLWELTALSFRSVQLFYLDMCWRVSSHNKSVLLILGALVLLGFSVNLTSVRLDPALPLARLK